MMASEARTDRRSDRDRSDAVVIALGNIWCGRIQREQRGRRGVIGQRYSRWVERKAH